MELPKKIKDEVWEYCRVNDIPNIDEFVTKMVTNGFTSEKFGSTPWEKPAVIKEVEIEVIKEVEVDKIVEVIKEVEVTVEKEVFITDDEANKGLKLQIGELETKIKTLKEENETNVNSGVERERELNDKIRVLNRKISDLDSNIKQLKEELETAKNKPKRDIYGDSYE